MSKILLKDKNNCIIIFFICFIMISAILFQNYRAALYQGSYDGLYNNSMQENNLYTITPQTAIVNNNLNRIYFCDSDFIHKVDYIKNFFTNIFSVIIDVTVNMNIIGVLINIHISTHTSHVIMNYIHRQDGRKKQTNTEIV